MGHVPAGEVQVIEIYLSNQLLLPAKYHLIYC